MVTFKDNPPDKFKIVQVFGDAAADEAAINAAADAGFTVPSGSWQVVPDGRNVPLTFVMLGGYKS